MQSTFKASSYQPNATLRLKVLQKHIVI